MKQRICLLLVLIVALSTASIAETNGAASEFGLKGFAWGDSMEKVKEVEGTNIASSGKKDDSDVSYIVYETMVAGHKMHLKYSFNNEGCAKCNIYQQNGTVIIRCILMTMQRSRIFLKSNTATQYSNLRTGKTNQRNPLMQTEKAMLSAAVI